MWIYIYRTVLETAIAILWALLYSNLHSYIFHIDCFSTLVDIISVDDETTKQHLSFQTANKPQILTNKGPLTLTLREQCFDIGFPQLFLDKLLNWKTPRITCYLGSNWFNRPISRDTVPWGYEESTKFREKKYFSFQQKVTKLRNCWVWAEILGLLKNFSFLYQNLESHPLRV